MRTKLEKDMPLNMTLSDRKIEYAHWDDPNELVDRLRLLDASRQAEEVHAPARRNFHRKRIIVREYDDLWQADVVEMRPYSRFNRVDHYIFTVIDVLSKYGSYKWIDILPRLFMEYNARKHRTIGLRPINVTPAIAEKLLTTVYSNVKIAGPARFKVGDSHCTFCVFEKMARFDMIFINDSTCHYPTSKSGVYLLPRMSMSSTNVYKLSVQ
ncbi:uncharacterized protein LOC109861074 [Pseudomyrmex gracilis]|uniref:uncharacterized protein LOC109861074 n=1 Tax=Pseudomyrmex gracilis TaxID=219809 RepID=UPI0009954BF6|nr:uncharacterized protein LOC109861074 [Pseudomyrmex gracilis]